MSSAPRKCKDGIPRRITIPVDPESGEIRNPHMKLGREALEKWSITPDNLIQDFRTWITNHCNLLTSDTLRPLDDMSYVVSTRRLTTTFQVIQVLGTRAFMLLGRRLCLFRLLEQRKGSGNKNSSRSRHCTGSEAYAKAQTPPTLCQAGHRERSSSHFENAF